MRSLWFRLLALVAALALAVPAFAWSNGRFLCQMTGRLGQACCCAKAHAKHAERKVPAVDQKSCCERVDVGAPLLAPKASELSSEQAFSLPPSAIEVALVPAPRTLEGSRPGLARAPPPNAKLFLVHCALLI